MLEKGSGGKIGAIGSDNMCVGGEKPGGGLDV